MIAFPNAKINLGLQVIGKRTDGFHNLATVFYPLPCTDVLEAVRSEQFSFSTSGSPVNGKIDENLCIKAWKLLDAEFNLGNISMHLHKNIPMGAGLGGGSADGAFTLKLLNALFQLNLDEKQLLAYALELGSDCPFFILNRPCYATGRGEIMEPIDIPVLLGKKILLVNPGLHISTAWAFSQLNPAPSKFNIPAILNQPIDTWKNSLRNDFEELLVNIHPQLASIRAGLYDMGAYFAGMSGSGSTMFGIFDDIPEDSNFNFDKGYTVIPISSALPQP